MRLVKDLLLHLLVDIGAGGVVVNVGRPAIHDGLALDVGRKGHRRLREGLRHPAEDLAGRERKAGHVVHQARQPLGFFDGSVRLATTRDCRPAANPNTPVTTPNYTEYFIRYAPQASSWRGFDPPTVSGQASDQTRGAFRWTRFGLKGIDFGGGEVPWRGS